MKIKSIRAVKATPAAAAPDDAATTSGRREAWIRQDDVPHANPLSRYPRHSSFRPWKPIWGQAGCLVEAEDGTWGYASAVHGRVTAAIIDDYLGPRLEGEDCFANETIYDLAVRYCSQFGASGLASYAISAIDLAVWDLKGKLLGSPVYSLIGGPARDEISCYATGRDSDWYMELGFEATKVPGLYGPSDGPEGMRRYVEYMAAKRELVGADVDLMLDCWMGLDIPYAVQLFDALRPYNIELVEECLPADDLDAYAALKAQVPMQALGGGEHWYGTLPFQRAAKGRFVDVFQPDINWVGGLTPLMKICAIAESSKISVIPHAGANTPYGQHACFALPAIPKAEYFVATNPGVPLQPPRGYPGMAIPVKGAITPSDAPGFGVELRREDLVPFPY